MRSVLNLLSQRVHLRVEMLIVYSVNLDQSNSETCVEDLPATMTTHRCVGSRRPKAPSPWRCFWALVGSVWLTGSQKLINSSHLHASSIRPADWSQTSGYWSALAAWGGATHLLINTAEGPVLRVRGDLMSLLGPLWLDIVDIRSILQ